MMMTTLMGVIAGGTVCFVALLYFVSGLRGLSIVRRVLGRKTTPIAQINQEGAVELYGQIKAHDDTTPITSLTGHRCIALRTTVRGFDGTGKQRRTKGEASIARAHFARLVDRSTTTEMGCTLELDSNTCEIVGQRWESSAFPISQIDGVTWLEELVPMGSSEITIEEHFIVDGATVLVAGEASRPQAIPADAAGAYRGDGSSSADPSWVIKGRPANLLVVSEGTEASLLFRAGAPAALIVIASLYLASFGALVIAVSLSM